MFSNTNPGYLSQTSLKNIQLPVQIYEKILNQIWQILSEHIY